jgi:hypothetical protein
MLGLLGLADYLYVVGKAKRIVVNALPQIDSPVMGSNRVASHILKTQFDSFAPGLNSEVVTALGIDPTTQKNFYRLEVGFAGYLIDVRTGNLDYLQGPVPGLASWCCGNAPGGFTYGKAVYAQCLGGLNVLGANGFTVDGCPPFVNTNGPAMPREGISPLYENFFRLGRQQPPTDDFPFKVMAAVSSKHGTYRQVYNGEPLEYQAPVSTVHQQITDGIDLTTHRYLRHSVMFGIHLSIDLRFRFTGKLIEWLGLNPVVKIDHMAAPRSLA